MSQAKDTILTVRNLHKDFGGVKAVSDADFTVRRNSITGLIGPNGAGKTTVFNLLTGVLKTDQGEVIFNNENITKFPTYKRAQAGLTRTFQAIRIFPKISVLENLKVALKVNKQGLRHIFHNQKKLQAKLDKEALALLDSVGLADKAEMMAGELSYGQQKLLEILRSTAINPEMILLDEPAAGINPTMLRGIIDFIQRLQKEGKTILIIEHNMGFIMELCEKIIVMDRGSDIAVGPPKQIQKDKKVLEAYLGTNA